MRPALKSGLLPVWRDRDTLQIGIDPRRAVALSGMGRAAFVIGLLDGSRDRDQVLAAAAAHGIPVQATERILTLLAAGGALDDFPASTLRELPLALRAKLAPELATTSLAYRDGDGGARALARRRAAVVRIEGDRRIGRAAARLLNAAGIRQLHFVQQPADDGARSAGGGKLPESRGPRSAAQPNGAAWPTPDLIILAGRQPVERHAQLAKARVPHLAVMAGEAIGVVGPLVVPGRTACLLCLDYVRAGNDPAWPLILSQIRQRRPEPPACDAVLATAVAVQAAAQALTAIEKGPMATAATNGTLELVLPDWRWRRRTWPPHPACPCGSHTVGNRQWRS
jgi:bacteriocin biosynthesis cyclodehydratase domain-containing protein